MNTILDAARTQVFAEQALGMVNVGFLSLMMSTGHRTGLSIRFLCMPGRCYARFSRTGRRAQRSISSFLVVSNPGCRRSLSGIAASLTVDVAPRSRPTTNHLTLPQGQTGSLDRRALPADALDR
jgi:hypothetical protein